jgi:hypothetical protein
VVQHDGDGFAPAVQRQQPSERGRRRRRPRPQRIDDGRLDGLDPAQRDRGLQQQDRRIVVVAVERHQASLRGWRAAHWASTVDVP